MLRSVTASLPVLPWELGVCALLVWCALPLAADAQLKDEVSSITGAHRVASESLRDVLIETYAGSDVGLRAEYVSEENGRVSWTLSFYGFADAPTGFATAPNVRLVADGTTMQPLRTSGKTRTMQDGSVLEIRTLTFSRPVFERIARAESVKATVGSAQLTLSGYSRRDMERILDRVLPASGQRTASSDSGRAGS